MKRYYIETAKSGITDGGMACGGGPAFGNVVATIQLRDETKSQWLSLVEVDGIPNVYITDKDVYEDLMAEDFDDEEFIQYMDDHNITEFDGIEFDVDYSTTFESIAENPENPAVPLIRYLIILVRCDRDDVEKLIQMATGKYADELDIPKSDVEEDFMDEYEDDEDFMEERQILTVEEGDQAMEDETPELEVECCIKGFPKEGIKVLGMQAGAGDGYYTTLFTYHAEICIDDNGVKKYLLCSYCEGGYQFEVLPESVIEGLVFEEGFSETADRINEMRSDNEFFAEIEMTKDSRYHELFLYMYDYIRNEIGMEEEEEEVEE